MKTTTRLIILNVLKKRGLATVPELSRSLGITRANVRHHLVVLEIIGLIKITGKKQEGRGRPVKLYGLSDLVLGNNLDKLSSAILETWLKGFNESDRDKCLQALAVNLSKACVNGKSGHPINRLAELVHFLNRHHYKAHWEAGPSGAKLILDHCPYMAIIEKHPELCILDAYLFRDCIEKEFVQSVKLERTESGLLQCVFIVREPDVNT